MKQITLIAAIALLMTGCATRPESISASFVSFEKYMGLDCPSLVTAMTDSKAQLARVSGMQNTKANIDAATVFLAFVPVSKLSGDHAADVAKYKGEVEAIETAQVKRQCKQMSAT